MSSRKMIPINGKKLRALIIMTRKKSGDISLELGMAKSYLSSATNCEKLPPLVIKTLEEKYGIMAADYVVKDELEQEEEIEMIPKEQNLAKMISEGIRKGLAEFFEGNEVSVKCRCCGKERQ